MYLKNIADFYHMTTIGLKYYWLTCPKEKKPMIDAFVRKYGIESLERPSKK